MTGDSDLTVAALLAPGTISYREVYERKEFLVAGGGFEPLRRIDNTHVIDSTYRYNSEKRTTRKVTGHRQDTGPPPRGACSGMLD